MPSLTFQQSALLSICLLMGACTETSVRDAPSDGSAVATDSSEQDLNTSILGDASNMVTPNPIGTVSDEDTAEDPTAEGEMEVSTGDTDPASDSTFDDQQANNNPNTLQGSPGETVDCERTVPCTWNSANSQLSLTVTNADNIATRSRLSINYSIQTSHDTNVVVSRADDAIDSAGLTLSATDQRLGGGNGGSPQGLNAGTVLEGTMNFGIGSSSDTLAQWSISILDSGQVKTANFINIPVGTVTTEQADCNNTLPCVWTTPQNDVAITLQSVGGILSNGRLTVNFSIETTTNMSVTVDAGAMAVGATGTALEGRTHTFGIRTDFTALSADVIAGFPLYGSVNFFRTELTPSSLQVLALVMYQDNPVPRWNPRFINVPVQ